jgi:hypothetical protein
MMYPQQNTNNLKNNTNNVNNKKVLCDVKNEMI